MTYDIAARIPIEARRRAVAVTYDGPPGPAGRRIHRRARVDGGYRCPLGVCLDLFAPTAPLVADVIHGPPYDEDTDTAWRHVARDAGQFIDDWDAGIILDLADALGVTD